MEEYAYGDDGDYEYGYGTMMTTTEVRSLLTSMTPMTLWARPTCPTLRAAAVCVSLLTPVASTQSMR